MIIDHCAKCIQYKLFYLKQTQWLEETSATDYRSTLRYEWSFPIVFLSKDQKCWISSHANNPLARVLPLKGWDCSQAYRGLWSIRKQRKSTRRPGLLRLHLTAKVVADEEKLHPDHATSGVVFMMMYLLSNFTNHNRTLIIGYKLLLWIKLSMTLSGLGSSNQAPWTKEIWR